VQTCAVAGRVRVATASSDKAHGVCIWDLDEMCNDSDGGGGVSVKLESGIAASVPAPPRGLLAVLPNHLSAVNVVRWEPLLGHRLASGSDLQTQSIIIWKREMSGAADSSTPFGMAMRAASSAVLRGAAVTPGTAAAAAAQAVPPAFPNVEVWHAHQSLHGQADITDLAWAPIGLHFRVSDDLFSDQNAAPGCMMEPPEVVRHRILTEQGSQVLASGSLDRSVVVWNVDTGDRHHLKGHSGWVLGITFDPQGMFLATQTIDGFVWIWNLANFQLVRKIKDVGLTPPASIVSAGPRLDVGRTVSMSRISWSPDGAALVACRGELKRGLQRPMGALLATAANTQAPVKHVSVVFNRQRNFDTQAVFGGHSGRTTVSAFNPVLFCANGPDVDGKSATTSFFSVLAIGSQDCVLSLWSSRRSTPLLLLTEVWQDGIVDLAWSGDGTKLLIASHDGSIVVLQFDVRVFEGRIATQQEHEARLKALYGRAQGEETTDAMASSTSLTASHGLYESPLALQLHKQQQEAQQKLRHIAEQQAQAVQRTASNARKQAELDRRIDTAATSSQSSNVPTLQLSASPSTLSQQTQVVQPGKKRRIIPVSVPSTDASASTPFGAGALVRSTSTSANNAGPSVATQLAQATPAMLMQMTSEPTMEAADLFAGAIPQPAKKQRTEMETAAVSSATTAAASTASPALAPAPAAPAVGAPASLSRWFAAPVDELLLPLPLRPVRWILQAPSDAVSTSPFADRRGVSRWEFQVNDFAGRALSAVAAPAAKQSDSTLVSAFAAAVPAASSAPSASPAPARQVQVWQSFVQHRVLLSVGNSLLLALACTDTASSQCYLHLLSAGSGRQLHAPLLLSAPPFMLSMRSTGQLGTLLVITCDGLVRVYEIHAADDWECFRSNGKKWSSCGTEQEEGVQGRTAHHHCSTAHQRRSVKEKPRVISFLMCF
jgi:WD40 repeat protein